jgi:hypothetical protein
MKKCEATDVRKVTQRSPEQFHFGYPQVEPFMSSGEL